MGWQRVRHDWATFTSLFSSSIIKKKKNLVLVSEDFLAKNHTVKNKTNARKWFTANILWLLRVAVAYVQGQQRITREGKLPDSPVVRTLSFPLQGASLMRKVRSCMLQWNNNKIGREGNRGKGVDSCWISYTHFRLPWRSWRGTMEKQLIRPKKEIL